jgi:hypothetical protein
MVTKSSVNIECDCYDPMIYIPVGTRLTGRQLLQDRGRESRFLLYPKAHFYTKSACVHLIGRRGVGFSLG